MRLDLYLVQRGVVPSRTKAQEWIAAGCITVDGVPARKPSLDVGENAAVSVSAPPYDYVGRGGVKLEAALDAFRIDASGLVCADIGASTGGFTDCLLRRGAAKVYAVDSGEGQLSPLLRSDGRVVSMEKTNARYLTKNALGEPCDLVVMDVSFISQTAILPAVAELLREEGAYVGLIKPQFECGRAALDKRGIVRDPRRRESAVRSVADVCASLGLSVRGLIRSPITGKDGNAEYLIHCIKSSAPSILTDAEISGVVQG